MQKCTDCLFVRAARILNSGGGAIDDSGTMMSAAEFESVKDLGTVQRVARQARCVIDWRSNDVAYWKARVTTLTGWQQGQGGVSGTRPAAAATAAALRW